MRHLVLAAALAAVMPAVAQEGGKEEPAARKQGEPVTSEGGLVLTGQEGWEKLEPKPMRAASWKLPRAEKDERDAELVVFWFKGGGGGVEANIERWAGQFQQPDGKSSKEAMKREKKEIAGLTVHLIDLSGTFVAETSPGSGKRVDQPDSRMLAAIVEGPNGPYFVKLVGPAATVEKWKESFQKFLEALRQAG